MGEFNWAKMLRKCKKREIVCSVLALLSASAACYFAKESGKASVLKDYVRINIEKRDI